MKSSYKKIQELLMPQLCDLNKQRYGGRHDGGYVMPQELVENAPFVYSYGIGGDPEGVEFDLQMAQELGKKVFMYDASIKNPPVNHENFCFKPQYLNADNFYEHIVENSHHKSTNIVAQIDIEGSEYEVFRSCSSEVFKHINCFSLEIHDLLAENPWGVPSLIGFKDGFDEKIAMLERINRYYFVFHVHANNHSYDGEIPNVVEATFVRKDSAQITGVENAQYPIFNLDFPCNPDRKDYVLDWWLKNKIDNT